MDYILDVCPQVPIGLNEWEDPSEDWREKKKKRRLEGEREECGQGIYLLHEITLCCLSSLIKVTSHLKMSFYT